MRKDLIYSRNLQLRGKPKIMDWYGQSTFSVPRHYCRLAEAIYQLRFCGCRMQIHTSIGFIISMIRPFYKGTHLVTSLIKRLIRGTFQGRFEPKYLQNYLDEYVFRFNRRKSKSIGKKFMRMVQQVAKSAKVTNSELIWNSDPISEYYAT
jgi:hypothetical protein